MPKPADLIVNPLPDQDVVIVTPSGKRFETAGWRNSNHTRHRLPGAVDTIPSHGHPVPTPPPDPEPEPEPEPEPSPSEGLIISKAELMALPTSGPAWNAVVSASNQLGAINLSNQDDSNDIRLMARALVGVRTNNAAQIDSVKSAIAAAINTENGGRTLALGRNLLSVVVAADLVGYKEAAFMSWLSAVRNETLDGRTLVSTHKDRPNNWGTHAGASRIAASIFLGDTADVEDAAKTFRGWLGDRSAYSAFKYSSPMTWHANQGQPRGINPAGSTIEGHNVDGVLPDDQRRAGGFSWPPSKENYVYEALQGAIMQAELLHRRGYDAWNWENKALLRAFKWLHEECNFPAASDDTWQPHLINARYGTNYPAPIPSQFGKNFGFTEWLYG